jgi:8-oxo-dGTP pyrophosphatase MutT (NUDIX family)
MKKIFFNDRFIAFCNTAEINRQVVKSAVHELKSLTDIPYLLNRFLYNGEENELYITCMDETETFVAFCDLFEMIFAAGGLVRNANNDLLLIYRYQHWDLPKGKQETGENIADTAVREVQEECGITNIKTGEFLTETYHCYSMDGRLFMKRNFWYKMFCDTQTPVPQTTEDIEKAEFVPVHKLPEYINSMYASIREVLIADGLII